MSKTYFGDQEEVAGRFLQLLLAPYAQSHWSHWLRVESGRWVLGKS